MAMVHRVEGAVDARTEQVAYVGENAVLGCPLTELYTVSYPNWETHGGVTTYAWSGKIIPLYAHRVSYYTDNISLVINNITLSDAGSYTCSANIYGIIREGINTLHTRIRPQAPVISNRQSDGSVTGTEGQPLTLTCTSRGGYPAPTVTWFRGSTARASSNFGPLEGDGYTVTATYTLSPTSSYDGSIYICQTSYTSPKLDVLDSVNATLRLNLRPQPPVISNRQSDGSVTGTEGQPLTLTCTSRGGDPAPTVNWYRGSTQSTALTSSNSVPLVGDGYMYTVTATHTFTPTSADDGSIYICQTAYTSPTLDVLDNVTTILRLNLKPSHPTVVQDGDVVAGSTVILRCTTSGFRPADSIAISWTYKGGDYSQFATTTTTQTGGTDTYTTASTLQFTVQKVDNGGTAKCIVAHSTLGTSLTGIATIDVHYAPESAAVTGNHVIVANGVNTLTLTCNVGVGNPAATTISWTRTSRTGTVSTQNPLVLRPTRDDDGDTVTCTADNGIGSVASGPATLDLNLKPSQPTVEQVGDVVAGSTVIVRCTTSGFRPEAIAISWTYNGGDYSQFVTTTTTQTGGTDTYTAMSTLQFTVQKVDNGGTAKCIVAHSTLGTSLTGTATIDVHYKPKSATVTGNHVIVASGVNTLTLTCNVRVGNPAATTISWTRTSRTGTAYSASSQNPLVLRPTRDDDGDTVTCTADNTIGSVTSGPVTLNLNFHPSTTLTVSPTGAVTEGPTDVTLQCSAYSKPAPTITWYHNGDTLQGGQLSTGPAHNTYVTTYNITSVSRQDVGEYKCIATNTVSQPTGDTSNTAVVTLDVHFPPQSAIIEGNRVIETDGHNKLYLNCVVGESNPISAISWSKTGTVDIGTTNAMLDATGSYGGSTRSQVLELTPTRDDDGDTITCTAGNGVGQSVTHTITLNLKYSAIASIVDETLIEGASSKDLTCNANSKPAARFTWYKGTSNTALASEPGTGSGSQWTSTYTISGVDRSHAGQYRCDAYNGVGASDEKNITLTVYYPPDVTATAQLNNGQLVATCSPSGVPDSYHYSNWVHLWSDGTRINQTPSLAATQTLLLTHLTYRDSGIYTCGAGNGVGLNGAMSANYIKQGSTSVINIESLPIIIGTAEQKVPITLHEPTTVSITYYSNVADSTVSCHRVVNNITQPQSVGEVLTKTSPIQLPVYESVVSEQGTSATVNLALETKDELGSYVVKITNTVGTAVVHLLALPEGPPEMPLDPRVEAVYTTSVNISWELGYHGGLGQIFIIQYSIDGKTWTDGATLDTGISTSRDRHYVTVDSLSPGTLYSVRIYANNNHGKSLDTAMINVTTSTIGADRRTSSSVVGPAVGGSAAALIVIALVVGLVVIHRKGYSITRPCTEKSNTYRDHTHENEVVTNETRHEMCQARAASPTRDEGQAADLTYERLTTTRVTTSAMYDELNITGAGLVGDTTRDGSVAGPYETLEPRQGENESFS